MEPSQASDLLVAKAGLELLILLSLPPECQDYSMCTIPDVRIYSKS